MADQSSPSFETLELAREAVQYLTSKGVMEISSHAQIHEAVCAVARGRPTVNAERELLKLFLSSVPPEGKNPA